MPNDPRSWKFYESKKRYIEGLFEKGTGKLVNKV